MAYSIAKQLPVSIFTIESDYIGSQGATNINYPMDTGMNRSNGKSIEQWSILRGPMPDSVLDCKLCQRVSMYFVLSSTYVHQNFRCNGKNDGQP